MEKSLEELFKLVHIFLKYLPYFWQNSFFRKCLNKFVQTDTECEQKNLIQRQQIVKLYQNFLAFFFFIIFRRRGKQYQFRGGAICYKPPFPRQMMTNKEVFYPRFL